MERTTSGSGHGAGTGTASGQAAEALRDRGRGALLGLAVGDALGAPAENMRPSEIRRRWGRIEGFVSDDPAGTDDTEYAIFSGLLLARHGAALTVTHAEDAWHHWLADLDEGPFRGAGFSERGTLENLRRGLAAPITAQHRHAWSDGLAMRAAPFGVYAAGRPAEAARLVAVDGTVSHDGEGIYGGRAVAAGVAAAMTGAGPASVVAAALSVIPMDSWTARSLRRAVVAAGRAYPDRLTMERAVRSAVVIGGYPWTDLAPEAVGLAFGAFAVARGDFRTSVLTAVNMGRDADTTAAVAGALSGALSGAAAIPREWSSAIGPVRGSCLPSMRGYHVLDIADLLTDDAGANGYAFTGARRPTPRGGPAGGTPTGSGAHAVTAGGQFHEAGPPGTTPAGGPGGTADTACPSPEGGTACPPGPPEAHSATADRPPLEAGQAQPTTDSGPGSTADTACPSPEGGTACPPGPPRAPDGQARRQHLQAGPHQPPTHSDPGAANHPAPPQAPAGSHPARPAHPAAAAAPGRPGPPVRAARTDRTVEGPDPRAAFAAGGADTPGPAQSGGHGRTDDAPAPGRSSAEGEEGRAVGAARPGGVRDTDRAEPAVARRVAGRHGSGVPRCEHVVAGPAPARERVEGLLLGLAAGDAAGWPAARHRAARMPEWTRRLTRELDTFAEQNATTTLPVPIALNQPPEPLRLGPSDDAEWAAFTAGTVLAAFGGPFDGLSADRRTRAAVDLAWHTLAGEIAAAADRAPEVESAVLPLRARISVRAGLGNLATGLRPPATGHDNPHYFDDAACVRAAVLAVVHPGRPYAAAGLAEFDARYTQDGDGVHGARAMAAAVAAALGGADTATAVAAALEQLPSATEIGRNARHAVGLARGFAHEPAGAFALVPLLEHQIVDHVYSYGIAAAETVPVALALTVAARGDVRAAVPAAACLSRVADSAPALAGALTGALGGGAAVPPTWRDACRTLAGCALPRLAGTDLVELAGRLTRALTPSAPTASAPTGPAAPAAAHRAP